MKSLPTGTARAVPVSRRSVVASSVGIAELQVAGPLDAAAIDAPRTSASCVWRSRRRGVLAESALNLFDKR